MKKFDFEKPNQEQLGSLENPIIDSNMSIESALRPNPNCEIPERIFWNQVMITVKYLSFDGKYHQGQIILDKKLQKDIKEFFEFLLKEKFRVNKAVPVAHEDYCFDDTKSMKDNNSSGFNPRFVGGTTKLSKHGMGWAIDLNPIQNPYFGGKEKLVTPINPKDKKASGNFEYYNIDKPGTITPWIADFLIKRGWTWGLEWYKAENNPIVDIHHFEKILGEIPKIATKTE